MQENKSFFGSLLENISKPFLKSRDTRGDTINPNDANIEDNLTITHDDTEYVVGFFDDGSGNSLISGKDRRSIIKEQNEAIATYRRVAQYAEVGLAIDEIVNELCFNFLSDEIVSLNFKDDSMMSELLKDSMINVFNEVKELLNIDENLDDMVRRFYIDGQLILGLSYKNKKEKEGIKNIYLMSPINFFYDNTDGKYKYENAESNSYGSPIFLGSSNSDEDSEYTYSKEEIVRIDSGMYHNGVILSDLQNVIKIVNQLTGLEDMVSILRFSRSMSRRVFNIDVGNLPYEKAMRKVNEIKEQFKYKKSYNPKTGSINNNSSVQSIVEDYFFASRGGAKGTNVDVLDESGNLGEMGDLDYFNAKLLNSLKVPTARLIGENKSLFDYSATAVEASEMKFFAFIKRKRKKFNTLFLEIMRRHCISQGILSNEEFDLYSKNLVFVWSNENAFLERYRNSILKERLDTYNEYKEYEGDIFSRNYLLKNVLKLTDEEIEQLRDEIVKEGGEEDDSNIDAEEEVDEFGNTPEDEEVEVEDTAEEEPINASKEDDENADIEDAPSPKELESDNKVVPNLAVRAKSGINPETLKPLTNKTNDGFARKAKRGGKK